MTRNAKRFIFLIAIVVMVPGVISAWWFLPGRRTDVRLSSTSREAVPRSALPVDPIHLQADPLWASEKIGGSGEAMRRVGCTICCLSMALTHHGIPVDPMDLNEKLKEANGFTSRGWVIWDAVRRVSDGTVSIVIPEIPTNEDIEGALDEGNPVLVKVLLKSGVHHWVLLVGRDQQEYLMKDPLGDGTSLGRLSSIGSDILAVRIAMK